MILGEALRIGLGALGVDTFYGDPAEGLDVVPAPAPWAAELMRHAHDDVAGRAATVTDTADGLRVDVRGDVSEPGDQLVGAVTFDSPGQLGVVLGNLAECAAAGSYPRLVVRADLGAPIAESSLPGSLALQASPSASLDAAVVERLAAATKPLLLVGPGVVRRRCVPGLHAAAAALDCGVLNTWGAKGVFDWRSPHHWATVGLQQRDYVLGGVDDADLVLAASLDPALAPPASVTVRPESLPSLAAAARGRPPSGVAAGTAPMPPLRTLLAEVTQRGWEHSGDRAMPSQVTRNYSRFTNGRGLVAADPSHAGYWVARTFPTTVLGEAIVPEAPTGTGFALAAVLVALRHQPARPVIVVLDGPLDDRSSELLEWARSSSSPIIVEVWEPDGPPLDAASHAERLERARWSARSDGPVVLHVSPEKGQLDQMLDVAGSVIAWGGIAAR